MSTEDQRSEDVIAQVPCIACGHPMPTGYALCSLCKSYQDWRRLFSFSAPILSLLVALVSVLALTAPLVVDNVWPNRGSINAAAGFVSKSVTRLSLINLGLAEAVVSSELACRQQKSKNSIAFTSAIPTLVKAGEQQSVEFTLSSTWIGRAIQGLESDGVVDDEEIIRLENELKLNRSFKCTITASDKYGRLRSVYLSEPVLSLYVNSTNGKIVEVEGAFFERSDYE